MDMWGSPDASGPSVEDFMVIWGKIDDFPRFQKVVDLNRYTFMSKIALERVLAKCL